MANTFLRWWGCGAFDVRLGDVNFTFDPYLFNDNLANAQPIFDYIFISHEHFDHCHPPTLKKLSQGARFKQLFVSPGCVSPDTPVDEKYGDAAFERDLPIIKHIDKEKMRVVYPKLLNDTQGLDRQFPRSCEFDLGPLHVQTIESGENQRPDLPTCGYLVRHREKNLSFLHIGDLHESYASLIEIRGQVDFCIHMKLGLTEWQGEDNRRHLEAFLDLVQPKFLIPTHYRTDRGSDPIPHGHWPPNATDVAALIESIREIANNSSPKTKVLPFTAGIEYEIELPSKQIQWKWNWHKTWTVPPWRDTE